MIRKIIQWIRGTNNNSAATNAAEAPYKLESPLMEEASLPVLEEAVSEPAVKPAAKSKKKTTAKKATAIKTKTVDVTAKYKKSDLDKLSKKELQTLVTKHNIQISSRTTKDELVTALLKV